MISLLYHDVVAPGDFSSSGFSSADANAYKLTRPEFEGHLRAIQNARGRGEVVVMDSAAGSVNSKALLFTFDDGGASALSIALLLEEFGWRGHFFITTDYIGKPGFLTADEIRELHRRGHVVGSHSCSHPTRMSHCTREELEREWTVSLRVLSEILGHNTQVASVPGGYYSNSVAEVAAAAGVEVLFNSEPTGKVQKINGCLVLGRYSIMHGDSAKSAASLAQGAWLPRFQQYLYWNSKKIAKRLGGSYYLRLRESMFRNRDSAAS